MNKFIITATGEEIKIGEKIHLFLSKNNGNLSEKIETDCPFIPPIIPLLLENGIINIEDSENLSLEDRVINLEERVAEISEIIKNKGRK